MTDVQVIRLAIDMIKEFALITVYDDPLDLAKQQFVANPNTHNNWDMLSEQVKDLNVKIAEAAIYELSTGRNIK